MSEGENIATSMEVYKKQWKIFAGLLTVLVGSVIAFSFIGSNEAPLKEEKNLKEHAMVYDVTRAVDDKSYWVFESERKLAEQEKQQAHLLKQIEEIRQSLPHESEEKHDMEPHTQEVQQLRDRILELEIKLAQEIEWQNGQAQEESAKKSPHFTFPEAGYYGEPLLPKVTEIFSEVLALEKDPDMHEMHIEQYIPANSYASAVLLNGADISAGVASQANPQPLTLHITDNGSLPNHKSAKLEDCRVSVAAYGDLSSERVFMRLERLTCVDQAGYATETDVEGNVVGRDGKNGIRGRMAIRDGEMLKRGFMGGFLSGLGKATAQSLGTTSLSALGAISTTQGADAIKSAGAEGTGNAFELLARYNIQRAEQYQPVIQISGGESVHIVFNKGVKLSDKRMKQRAPKLASAQAKPLWEKSEWE